MRASVLCCFAILCASSTAIADGDVTIDLGGDSEDDSAHLVQGSDGRLYVNAVAATGTGASALSQPYLLAFDSDGAPINTFGTGGRVVPASSPSNLRYGALAVRPDGSVITGYSAIATFSPVGANLSTLHLCGNAPCPLGIGYVMSSFLPAADGKMYAAGGVMQEPTLNGWTLARMTADGLLDPTYADGQGLRVIRSGETKTISRLQSLPSGQFLAIGEYSMDRQAIGRFNADGTTDFTFGTNGILLIGENQPFLLSRLVVDSAQRMLMGGETDILQRRNPDGSADDSYVRVASSTETRYGDLDIDSQDRVVVFGTRNEQAYVARLLPDGGLDPDFGTGGEIVFMPSTPAASFAQVSAGIVDSADRPIALMDFVSQTGRRDLALVRLTTQGVIDASFGADVADADVYPDSFSFASDTAPYGTSIVESGAAIPAGYEPATSVILTATPPGSEFSIGCTGTWQAQEGRIVPGQSLCLRHAAPLTPGASVTTTVSVGGRSASYTTTASAIPADTTPEPFSLAERTGVARNTDIVSNTVTITGITGAAPVSVENGSYSVGCNGTFRSSSGTITNGQTICVELRSPAAFGTSSTATLAIGGVSDTFTVTTEAEDTTPPGGSSGGGGGSMDAGLALMLALLVALRAHLARAGVTSIRVGPAGSRRRAARKESCRRGARSPRRGAPDPRSRPCGP
jgi:uncharacterized delta-60 repeat protein